jgi:hypothetical protein
METLNKSFDRLRTNGNSLTPFVVSLSNHERNQLIQRFPRFAVVACANAVLDARLRGHDESKNSAHF